MKDKKKKGSFKKIVLLVVLVLIIGISIVLKLTYDSTSETLVIDYDDMQDRYSDGLIHDYDYNKDKVSIDFDTNELNKYFNTKSALSDLVIDSDKYLVNNVALDSSNSQLYLNVSNAKGKTYDVITSYTLTIKENKWDFQVTPLTVGSSTSVFNNLALRKMNFSRISIPVEYDSETFTSLLLEEILYVSGENIKIDNNRKTIDISVDVEDLALLSKSIEEITPLTSNKIEEHVEVTMIETTKQLAFNYNQVLADITKEHNGQLSDYEYLDSELDLSFYTIDSGQPILRVMDTETGLGIDYAIELAFDEQFSLDSLEPVSEQLESLETDLKKLSSKLMDHIDSDLNTTLASLKDYEITNVDIQDQLVLFDVEQTSWTIMIYMNGSDLESGVNAYTGEIFGKASEDLEEMMSGLDSDNINVIVETGGTLAWAIDDINPDINQRFKIENNSLIHLQDLEQKNMTHPDTLVDFANYAIEAYPSEKYALLMWDHGGGSLYGFGVDEHFYGDSLTLDELELALSEINEENDTIFEVIGFDACLMATLETAVACAPYANYLIASEETEPDYGWDYNRIFETLADGDAYDGDSFGELVVSGFIDYSVEANQEEMLTLSVIDLSKIDKVVSTMDTLLAQFNEESYDSVSRVIPQIKAFGGNTEYTGFTDHYDLENFAKKLLETNPSEANKLIAAIDAAVIYKANGYLANDAGGISFYLPFYDLTYEEEIDDIYSPVSFSEDYTSFMENFVEYRLNNSFDITDITYDVDTSQFPYTFTIAPQYMEYVSNVFMDVLLVDENDGDKYYIDLGYDAWVSETTLTGVYNSSFQFWPSIDENLLPISVTYVNSDYIEYETPITLNDEQATLVTGWLFEEERYVVFGARPVIEDNTVISDRNTIEINEGDHIVVQYNVHFASTGWDVYDLLEFDVDANGIQIQDREFSEGTYAIEFVIEDLNGEIAFTDLYEFDY